MKLLKITALFLVAVIMLIACISCESLDGDDSENSTEVLTEGLKLKACIGGANSEAAIMLSESADFSSSSSKLEASISKITNVSGLELPKNLESKGNSRDSDDYLVYTFYLKNSADKSVNIQSELDIEQAVPPRIKLSLAPAIIADMGIVDYRLLVELILENGDLGAHIFEFL